MRASWLWLAGWFVLMTTGELYILPVGLALFGRMAPEGFRATSIATWFFAGFSGNLLAGALGAFWSVLAHGWFFALMGSPMTTVMTGSTFAPGRRAASQYRRHGPVVAAAVAPWCLARWPTPVQ
ncbi:hypothetical protein STENM36S_02045 [Streptomyces tendae]